MKLFSGLLSALMFAGVVNAVSAAELVAATRLNGSPTAVGESAASGDTASISPPEAIVPFIGAGQGWSDDVRSTLASVAARLHGDDSLIVSLRSLVPEAGSAEFGISVAEQALQRVRNELIALGVKPRRIIRDTLREFAGRNSGPRRAGVEVYVDTAGRRSTDAR